MKEPLQRKNRNGRKVISSLHDLELSNVASIENKLILVLVEKILGKLILIQLSARFEYLGLKSEW